MKVTVERAQLLKSLGHVHRVVERRNTIPILGNVLVRAESGQLALKATDLDLEVTETLAAETATGGSTTVPAHMFYDIVRKLPDGAQIVLEGDGDRSIVAIRAGRSRFTLQTLPENDFPDLAAGDMTHSFTLAASDMKRLIDRTQFAISTEETRYYLNGIPNSKIKSDPERAREMFSYAASYFGNADAQYDLARLYLKGVGATSRDDSRYGARWLGLAAQKGQHQAQALLGQMLFNGDQLPRQAARGLVWLTLARDSATPDETWIKESYNKAIARASEDDRAMALQMLEHWVQGRKD